MPIHPQPTHRATATPSLPRTIEASGLKVTFPRLRVLEIFEKSERRHLYAEDIYRVMLGEGEDASLATIYRVLTQFEQAGILIRRHFEGHKAAYELNDSQDHDHFLCASCGRVEEFESAELKSLLKEIATSAHYKLTDSMVTLNVECVRDQCPNKEPGKT